MGGDPHDAPMLLDYYAWAVVGPEHTFVVDAGFGADEARGRGRQLLRTPAEGLALIGVDADQVEDLIITPMHLANVVKEIFQSALNVRGRDADINTLLELMEDAANTRVNPLP